MRQVDECFPMDPLIKGLFDKKFLFRVLAYLMKIDEIWLKVYKNYEFHKMCDEN